MNFLAYAKLDEMKLMAGGNPQKMAEYAVMKNEFQDIKNTYFNEDHPFVDGFNESHLENLKKFAEDNPTDESAQIRYSLQKERFAVQESQKTAHLDNKISNRILKQKIESGKVSKADLESAALLVRRNGNEENRVIYATIKSLINEGAGE